LTLVIPEAFPSVTIGEKFCTFVNFKHPVCEKSEPGGLDNCGKKPKKTILAQQFPVFAAAGGGAAAVEGELLRQDERVFWKMLSDKNMMYGFPLMITCIKTV
jgi:hypothetical protein